QEYRTLLQAELKEKVATLCTDCADRYDKNPLRILDCKNEKCQEVTSDVPMMLDTLCDECTEHFSAVREALDALGESYVVNPRLVRGLDYYTKTAFEITSPVLGAQSSICGGGRYDNLLTTIGGPNIPGIGFAIGIERVLLALEAAAVQTGMDNVPDVFVATAGVAAVEALKLTMALREAGVAADKDYLGRSLKAQLKYAHKKGIRHFVILGEEEMKNRQATVRDMQSGTQDTVDLAELVTRMAAWVREAK
ncbi:MAG: histidine--tRNA ligase, partial [Firmicutes bacterium]|nr:histidine--tRNA ligase [Bacillota bacterium]